MLNVHWRSLKNLSCSNRKKKESHTHTLKSPDPFATERSTTKVNSYHAFSPKSTLTRICLTNTGLTQFVNEILLEVVLEFNTVVGQHWVCENVFAFGGKNQQLTKVASSIYLQGIHNTYEWSPRYILREKEHIVIFKMLN